MGQFSFYLYYNNVTIDDYMIMATIKSYTDIEQSKKLAEILLIESADMYWKNGVSDKYIQCFTPFVIDEDGTNVNFDYDIPCWSLAALLGILQDYTLQTNTDGTVFVVCESKKPMISDAYNNPVDACYEMILKLNDLNLL